jgi:chromosome segregation ATPase
VKNGCYYSDIDILIYIEQARREVGAIAKDIQAAQKQVAALDAKIEQKRGERHAILKQCKVSEMYVRFFMVSCFYCLTA